MGRLARSLSWHGLHTVDGMAGLGRPEAQLLEEGMKPITLDDEYSYVLHMQGSCSTLPKEHEDDTIDRLHAVIKEITGEAVEKPSKPRMGFLP